MLATLSAREQISLLSHSARSLSKRDQADLLGRAGLSIFRDRFLQILVHFFLKYVLTGTIWWFLCILAAFVALFLFVVVEQVSPHGVIPAVIVVVSFFAGSFIVSLLDFLHTLLQFFQTTRSHNERNAVFAQVDAQSYPAKVALLREVSRSLASKLPGESLLTSLLVNVSLLVVALLLIALIVAISHFLVGLDTPFLLLFLAVLSLILGYLSPGMIKKRISARSHNAK